MKTSVILASLAGVAALLLATASSASAYAYGPAAYPGFAAPYGYYPPYGYSPPGFVGFHGPSFPAAAYGGFHAPAFPTREEAFFEHAPEHLQKPAKPAKVEPEVPQKPAKVELPQKPAKSEPVVVIQEQPVVHTPAPQTGVKTAVTQTLIAPAINLAPETMPTKQHTTVLPAEIRPVTEQIYTPVIQPINREVIKPSVMTYQQPIIREEHPINTQVIQPVIHTTVREAPSSQIIPVHSTTQVDTVYNTITQPARAGDTIVGAPLAASPTQRIGDFSTPEK